MLKLIVLPQPEAKGRSFSWPPLEAALSVHKTSFFFVKILFFDRELIRREDIAITPNHKLSENVLP
jgi:hypothetical protein